MEEPAQAMAVERRPWGSSDFVGGDVAIDFVNTVSQWADTPRDRMADFDHWLTWCQRSGLLTEKEADRLAGPAAADPARAARQMDKMRTLRHALYGLFLWAGGEAELDRKALSILEFWWARDNRSRRLSIAGDHLCVDCDDRSDDPDLPFRRIARAAVDLLSSDPVPRIGRCANDECRWLFVDATKNKSRRWCEMSTCGNAAKARRFRQSRKEA